jgi:hypothetical protein
VLIVGTGDHLAPESAITFPGTDMFNDAHLRRLLRDFVAYYHDDRTHLGLDKDAPTTRAVETAPYDDAEVVSLPRLGGLHHRYSWRAPEGAWT